MDAVILAGGKGTRLSEFTKEIPKPLIPLNGKPVLEYQINNLSACGIKNITLVVGHLGDKIKEYFGNGSKFGVNINYFHEEKPLGTAGSLFYIKENLSKNFILMYGDIICDIDFNRIIQFHSKKNSSLTMLAHPNNHPYDSDVLIVDGLDKVKGILRKNQQRDFYYNNCVNAGIFVINKDTLTLVKENEKQDFEKDFVTELISHEKVYAYTTTEYVKDMGTPDRYKLVEEHLKGGIVKRKNLKNKQKAIFLDRDGTINIYAGLIHKVEQFDISEEIYEGLKMINSSEYIGIVITNQPVIARNLCTIEELENIHKKMETMLGNRGVFVDDIFFCPHHPDKGYPEENKEYKIKCTCRKPEIGLIEKAAEMYNIDLKQSFFIGDSTIDIQTGINAGVKTILLSTGVAGTDNKYDVKPDYYAKDLPEAIRMIIR